MNNYFKSIQEAFLLLDNGAKQTSFMTALEYMLKIAHESEYQTESCIIQVNEDGDVEILLASPTTTTATLKITANARISYIGQGPKKGDKIRVINSQSYSVGFEVFEWIKRNRRK